MKNKFYFNSQDLKRNKHLINCSNLSKCPQRNSHFFIKHFTKLEIPNLNNLSLNQNIFISTEQSTIITTEDFCKINKNNCKCICHEIDKKLIIHNMNKNSNNNYNSSCHLCDKSMINCSNIYNSIYQTNPKYNYIQRICRSVDNIGNTNYRVFNSIDKYKEYDDLYFKKLEHNSSILSRGKYNEYEKDKYIFRYYSNNDITIKDNTYFCNRSFNNLLEKTKNILNSLSFSTEYNRNKNKISNLYSPNLSYSFKNEERNYFSPLFENNKNKRYLSYSLHKNNNPFKNHKHYCIRNTLRSNKEIGNKILSRSENRENINKNFYIAKNNSLKIENIKNFYKFNTLGNNYLNKSFNNRYSHHSLDETIHSSINKNIYSLHPKSFGIDELDRNIYFPQNSEDNILKNKQKRIEKNNIKRIEDDIIIEEKERNPFKTNVNEHYCIQKVNNTFFYNNRVNKNNKVIVNKNNTKTQIISEINFNLINDKKKYFSNNNENINSNNKNNININIFDKVDNFNIIKDNNLQNKSKLKSYNKISDNIIKDNIISFNILKGKECEKKYIKNKFIDNKKENVNYINFVPLKKNNIQSKKKSEKDSSSKMEEKRNNNIDKIIESILSKYNKKEDKINKHKNNIKKTNNKNSNLNQIKKNVYHLIRNDGDINSINYQTKPITKNSQIKIEFQRNLECQNQNKKNNNRKDNILLLNHKINNSKILLNKKKDNFNSFYASNKKTNLSKNFIDNKINKKDNINENSIIFKLINGNNNPFKAKINKQKVNYQINQKIKELNEYNQNRNNIIEENSNHIFRKVNKISKSYANLIDRNYNKNKQKNNTRNLKRNNIPHLGFLNMYEIKKLNLLNNNNIKNPFNNVKTLNNSSNNKLIYNEIKTYENKKAINSNKDNIISDRKNLFDLSFNDKKKYLKYNNSCNFQNFLKLGNINYMTINRSVYIGSCFACDLGCSVSRSGYSPMTYSPYSPIKKRRKEITEMPKNIIYEQYSKYKKN